MSTEKEFATTIKTYPTMSIVSEEKAVVDNLIDLLSGKQDFDFEYDDGDGLAFSFKMPFQNIVQTPQELKRAAVLELQTIFWGLQSSRAIYEFSVKDKTTTNDMLNNTILIDVVFRKNGFIESKALQLVLKFR